MATYWFNGNVSTETLQQVIATWTTVPCKADWACAVRLCKAYHITAASEVTTEVIAAIRDAIDTYNRTYCTSTEDRDNLIALLAQYMKFDEAYKLVEGVNGSMRMSAAIQPDEHGRLNIDAACFAR